MKISFVQISNFKKLYRCKIDFSDDTTLFVGANNSGKTSAMDALGKFLAGRQFVFNDFTISNRELINEIGTEWEQADSVKPESIKDWEELLPTMDVWMKVDKQNIYHVIDIIPTLTWREGLLGVRLLYQPDDIGKLYNDYRDAYYRARETETPDAAEKKFSLFPKNLCDFLEKSLREYFKIKSYILDPSKVCEKENPQKTVFEMECMTDNPLKGIVRIDMINAQRGFSDVKPEEYASDDKTSLSIQMRRYYDRHLDPEKAPMLEDLELLCATEEARKVFDKNLEKKLRPAIKELEKLGYPGISNPQITISGKITTTEMLRHDSAVQYSLGDGEDAPKLPEKYNGLGYQNLISMVFNLIIFRDGWMRKGKANDKDAMIEPLHLVFIEEPEAHLHIQVQQVFIRKAYSILRNHEKLGSKTLFSTQLIISTHSSHIAREEKFANMRYFKRLPSGTECKVATSKVVNLCDVFGAGETEKFVTRYLQTTHCDLFFADGIIIVEGSAERMLLPHFIRNKYELLNQRYITILEISGRHSHRLESLFDKLAVPTLIITDLDSANREGHHVKELPKRNQDIISGNYAITQWLIKMDSFDELLDLPEEKKVINRDGVCNYNIRVAYQIPQEVKYKGEDHEALARTFEDSMIYSNMDVWENLDTKEQGDLITKVTEKIKGTGTFEELQKTVFDELKKSNVKAEFALDLIYLVDPKELKVPLYIDNGLKWLEEALTEGDEGWNMRKTT